MFGLSEEFKVKQSVYFFCFLVAIVEWALYLKVMIYGEAIVCVVHDVY